MKKARRMFVGMVHPLTNAQKDAHLRSICEQALQIANKQYHENEPKANALGMLSFLVLAMVALELDLDPQEVLLQKEQYRAQFATMGAILLMEWEHLGLEIPDGFPFTLEQLKAVVRK